jgi:hypothetical protein
VLAKATTKHSDSAAVRNIGRNLECGNRDHQERRVRRVIRPRGDEKSGAGTVGSGYSHSSASGHALSVQLGTLLRVLRGERAGGDRKRDLTEEAGPHRDR